MLEKTVNAFRYFSIILFLTGLFVVGFAITGHVVFGSFTGQNYCTSDITCSDGKTCCRISSTCSTPKSCDDLKNVLSDSIESPMSNYYSPYFLVGVFAIILAAILLILTLSINKKHTKKKAKTRKKR